MNDKNRSLVLLTASYPFGQVAETFLDAELPVLRRYFERLLVLPSTVHADKRALPDGVTCDLAVALANSERPLARHRGRVVREFALALTQERHPLAYIRYARTYLRILASYVRKEAAIARLVRTQNLRQAVFCDYWMENSTLALAWLRQRGIIKAAAARAHAFDIYDERWSTGAVPFMRRKLSGLDRVFPISEYARKRLLTVHPTYGHKMRVSRLGAAVPAHGARERRPGPTVRVVSCANLTPLKRVERIPLALSRLRRPASWVHFGEGPAREAVARAAERHLPPGSWAIRGHVPHSELLAEYAHAEFDVFISLSESEGLPVSMMEAIGFGIPIVATAVGGVPELVTAATGRTIDVESEPGDVAAAILAVVENGPSPSTVREFFEHHYEAERNYSEFAGHLCQLIAS